MYQSKNVAVYQFKRLDTLPDWYINKLVHY